MDFSEWVLFFFSADGRVVLLPVMVVRHGLEDIFAW